MPPKVICKENCEGAKRPSGGLGGGGGPGHAGKTLHLEPEITISDAYLG